MVLSTTIKVYKDYLQLIDSMDESEKKELGIGDNRTRERVAADLTYVDAEDYDASRPDSDEVMAPAAAVALEIIRQFPKLLDMDPDHLPIKVSPYYRIGLIPQG